MLDKATNEPSKLKTDYKFSNNKVVKNKINILIKSYYLLLFFNRKKSSVT